MTFNIKGVKYEFTFSFFALLCLTFLMTEGSTSAVCILSSFLHECGHLIPLYIYKSPPKRVVLAAFGIRIDRTEERVLSYKKEAVVSIGGILVNILLSFAGFAVWRCSAGETAFIFMFVNIFIGVLNSIPVSVLDLGRFLRYILLVRYDEEKVSCTVDRVSLVSVITVTVLTVLYTVFLGVNLSLIAVSIYLLILNFQERR